MKNHTMRLAGILTLSWVASAAHAQFAVTQLGAGTTATGINSTGQVTGLSSNVPFVTGANGVGMTLLGNPPGQGGVGYAQGINDTGQVVGYFVTYAGVEHAFATSANGASMIDLGTLGGSTSSADLSGRSATGACWPGGAAAGNRGLRQGSQLLAGSPCSAR